MKRSLRYVTLILAAVFLIAGTTLIASADQGAGGNQNTIEDGGENVNPDGGEIVDPGIDPGVDPGNDSGNSGNSGNDSGNSGNSGNNGNSGNSGNNEIISDGSNDNAADNGNNYNENNNADNNNDSGYNDSGYDNNQSYDSNDNSDSSQNLYVDDSPLYYGDAQNYDYNSSSDNDRNAGKIDATLYDAKVDKSIKAQKWENLDVPGSGDVKLNSGSADGDVSFASMKANNKIGDDMGYIPYIGVVLVALAVLGILYFIVATITQRKNKQTAGAYADDQIDAPAKSDKNSKSGKSGRTIRYADDYDDGYSATRKGSKADTGEIHLPRRFK